MPSSLNRRFFLQTASLSIGGLCLPSLWQPGAFAEELIQTPKMTEGPFYPDKLPLDTDNDLLVLNNSITPAVGEIVHLTGKVMTPSGSPLRNAFVEIWQVDNNGVYLHSGSDNGTNRDTNFQGYGRFLTDSTGRYYFRTVKPVPYPGRTPHIHVAVSRNGKRELTTQLLINGHPQNQQDGLFRAIRDPFQRESILVDFNPIPDSTIGELSANFDLVLGVTPDEKIEEIKGGIAPRQQG
ncbi:protocatechuate 3,4-dioxygenase [Thalassoglobus sp. JC818]|uniref:protocatechuate 3,4-dioxygenase n=1 Tax=Thalassoglobus sp. JC818 TaxID=3232136 RepID=UPI00345B1374